MLGDPATMKQTIEASANNVLTVHRDPRVGHQMSERDLTEWAADRG